MNANTPKQCPDCRQPYIGEGPTCGSTRCERQHEHRRLIDACNLLCEYVARNIAADCELCLTMSDCEAFLTLFDADGEVVELSGVDSNESAIAAACDDSHYMEGRS